MQTVLIVLGILGIGAIVVGVFVFTVAARSYVSSDHSPAISGKCSSHREGFVTRAPRDRRRVEEDEHFPIIVNSVLIGHDRRTLPDRRAAAT